MRTGDLGAVVFFALQLAACGGTTGGGTTGGGTTGGGTTDGGTTDGGFEPSPTLEYYSWLVSGSDRAALETLLAELQGRVPGVQMHDLALDYCCAEPPLQA